MLGVEIAPPDQASLGAPSIRERLVFSVDGEEYRWEDVLVAAHASGEWAQLESRAAEGVACALQAGAEGESLAEDDVSSTASAFRYERDLLSADEMEAWLERWDLDVDAWMAFIGRSLMRERWSAELAETSSRFPAPADEVREAVWVDAICSGALAEFARALAARAATHAALDGSSAPDPTGLEDSFSRFSQQALTPEALEHLLAAREMDWLVAQCRLLTVPDEGMAREAALCVRDDGMPLAEVARQAGATLEEVRVFLEDTEPPLRDMLVSAGEGELLGPLSAGDGFLLVAVDAKTRPSLEDPAVRERAESEVVERAVEQEVINRVRWHEQL